MLSTHLRYLLVRIKCLLQSTVLYRALRTQYKFSLTFWYQSLYIQCSLLLLIYYCIFQGWDAIKRLFIVLVCISLALANCVPLASLDQSNKNLIQALPRSITHIYTQVSPFHLVNPYGLFRRMTGVGQNHVDFEKFVS